MTSRSMVVAMLAAAMTTSIASRVLDAQGVILRARQEIVSVDVSVQRSMRW